MFWRNTQTPRLRGCSDVGRGVERFLQDAPDQLSPDPSCGWFDGTITLSYKNRKTLKGRDANRALFRQAGGEDESVAKPLIGRLGLYAEFPAIEGTESDGER